MGRIACSLMAAASAPVTASKAESGRSVVAAPIGTAPTTLRMATSFNCCNKQVQDLTYLQDILQGTHKMAADKLGSY